MGFLKRLWPQKLKYRLFAAVLLFILLPFFLLQIYAYRQIEESLTLELQDKASKQLVLMKMNMNDVVQRMFRYSLFLENDPDTIQVMRDPESMTEQNRLNAILHAPDRARSIELPSQVRLTVADRTGHLYMPDGQAAASGYQAFIQDEGFAGLTAGKESYRWVTGDSLSLYAILADSRREAFGYVRLDFQYESWLLEASRNLLLQQNYQIVDGAGTTLGSSDPRKPIAASLVHHIISGVQGREVSQLTDRGGTAIVTGSYLYDFNWYILSYLPMNTYLGNMNEIRSKYLYTFLILCLIFIGITFLISSTISRPLVLLRRKMAESAETELKTRVKEGKFKGEMRDMAVTFNTMMEDIERLLARLKQEERQKEALHYRMLTAQMNPHFLLNTLNTIKWNVLDKGDGDTADICIALGRLLETSFNSEVELVYLKNEMELLQAYVYIQNFRYDGLVSVEYEVEANLEFALVPKLSLQPLMENALKHGFAQMPEDACIVVRVYHQALSLILEIEDNGVGLERSAAANTFSARKGIGLANIEERLRLLFRQDGHLSAQALKRGTLARITLPLLISHPYQSGSGIHEEDSSAKKGDGQHVESAAGGG